MQAFSPRETVSELDRFIIGQDDAKKAVAIALRNRWRRQQLEGEIKEEILKAHKPIKDLFFKGLGNKLQFEDSCIAESVMLQFAHSDAPALPIHDSFVMHHGYGEKGGLEEAMRRAYFERFNSSLSEKRDLVEKVTHNKIRIDEDKKPINNDYGTIKVDDIINADSEFSQWRDRDRMWMSRK